KYVRLPASDERGWRLKGTTAGNVVEAGGRIKQHYRTAIAKKRQDNGIEFSSDRVEYEDIVAMSDPMAAELRSQRCGVLFKLCEGSGAYLPIDYLADCCNFWLDACFFGKYGGYVCHGRCLANKV